MAEPKASKNGLYPIKFVQPSSPYNPGDVAGFSLEVASRAVELGRAVWFTPADEPKPAAPKKEKEAPESVEDGISQAEVEAEAEEEEAQKSRRRRRFGSRGE